MSYAYASCLLDLKAFLVHLISSNVSLKDTNRDWYITGMITTCSYSEWCALLTKAQGDCSLMFTFYISKMRQVSTVFDIS